MVLGATRNLAETIRTHLFVVSPNNSGSTFVKNVLATSRHTWNLPREGQHMPGFTGPSSAGLSVPLLWAADPERIARFTRPGAFDWERSKKAWYFQAFSRDPGATVFVEKSPPFVLNVGELVANFRDARFLFMVRNPYAVVEGIARRCRRRPDRLPAGVDPFTAAARHVAVCFAWQAHNLDAYGERGVFFTYEEMCAVPEQVEAKIRSLVPVLDDLVLRQRVPVKGLYDEELRDMNAQQIARLTGSDVARINAVLAPHADLLARFGYALLDPPGGHQPGPAAAKLS